MSGQKLAGIIWLGARLPRSSFQAWSRTATAARVSAWAAVRQGTVNNLTDPKPLLFRLAFLPRFAAWAQEAAWMRLLALGPVRKLCGVVVLGSSALASGTLGGWLARRPGALAWRERFAGAVMVALGGRRLANDARPARV